MKVTFDHLDTTVEKLFPTFTWIWKRFVRGRPDYFPFLDKDQDGNYTLGGKPIEAEAIGPERSVVHLTITEFFGHAVQGALTNIRHLEGLPANAVYVDPAKAYSERLGTHLGEGFCPERDLPVFYSEIGIVRSYFQPVRIIAPPHHDKETRA